MTRQQLIEDNMRLVYHHVSKHYPTYIQDEDIIQCGMVGLIKAADNWDETKSKFSTFACRCIGNEIKNEFKRRAKHHGVLSLDQEIKTSDGLITLGDTILGDEDVCYVDFGIDVEKLKPREKQVFELLQGNMTYTDIGRELGITKQAVWAIARKLRKMRG